MRGTLLLWKLCTSQGQATVFGCIGCILHNSRIVVHTNHAPCSRVVQNHYERHHSRTEVSPAECLPSPEGEPLRPKPHLGCINWWFLKGAKPITAVGLCLAPIWGELTASGAPGWPRWWKCETLQLYLGRWELLSWVMLVTHTLHLVSADSNIINNVVKTSNCGLFGLWYGKIPWGCTERTGTKDWGLMPELINIFIRFLNL